MTGFNLTIPAAEIAAFRSTQDQLRQQAGTVAMFGVPTTPQWPAGTKINPDTGAPYDATVVPENAAYEQTPVTVLVIEKQGSPLRPQADPSFTPSGLREGMDIILDVAVADYEATVANASMFTVLGADYNIVEAKPFSLGGQTYRYLVYGQER